MPMKHLGLITLFSGIDILKTKYYLNISCQTYLEKISVRHLENWMDELKMITHRPLPMPATESFIKAFNAAVGDPDPKIQKRIWKESTNLATAVALVKSSMPWSLLDRTSPQQLSDALRTVLARPKNIIEQSGTS
jgi:hypothetical protein